MPPNVLLYVNHNISNAKMNGNYVYHIYFRNALDKIRKYARFVYHSIELSKENN